MRLAELRLHARCTLALSVTAAASALGCESPLTEMVVVTDTDLRTPLLDDGAPIDIDRVTLLVDASAVGGQETTVREIDLVVRKDVRFPLVFPIVHESGPLGPITVIVAGMRGPGHETVIERSARFTFIKARTLMLRLDLLRTCVDQDCGPGRTCGPIGCRDIDISSSEYEGPGELQPYPIDADMPEDGGRTGLDARMDLPMSDGGTPSVDARIDEAGGGPARPMPDAGRRGHGHRDAGSSDAETTDAGVADTGPADTGTPDAGPADTGMPDAGGADTGMPDAAPPPPPPDAGLPQCLMQCDEDERCDCPDGCECTASCVAGEDCEIRCRSPLCRVHGENTANLEVRCEEDAQCFIQADEASNVRVDCGGSTTNCQVECHDVSNCEVDCRGSAACAIQCQGASNCSFTTCSSHDEMTCGGNRIVCGMAC